jgi:hypothetical protein
MDMEGRGLRLSLALHHIPVQVADQKAGGGDLGEGEAIGIDQEQVRPPRHHGGEVVADALLQPVPHRHAKAGRHVHAQLPQHGPVQRLVGGERVRRLAGRNGMGHGGRSYRLKAVA